MDSSTVLPDASGALDSAPAARLADSGPRDAGPLDAGTPDSRAGDADSRDEGGEADSGRDTGTFRADSSSASDSPTTRDGTSCTLTAPVVSPPPGTYMYDLTVTVTDPNGTPGDQIFYTTDGSTPSAQSLPYTGPITLSASATVKVIVVNPSCPAPSPVTAVVYSVMFPQNPPLTCAEQGIACGPASNGFGGELYCGTCTPPATCGGGGVPGQCGAPSGMDACMPQTCVTQGIACGPAADGCGGLLDCGLCTSPQTCGGGGVPGQCGE
jgi:Chitobiase/beta-hexosaminidase C-terminal domain